jgi:hypothetical protein
LTIFPPSASRTDALRPVPPMSIASVVGPVDRFALDPRGASFTSPYCLTSRLTAMAPRPPKIVGASSERNRDERAPASHGAFPKCRYA